MPCRQRASFWTQAGALTRKQAAYQVTVCWQQQPCFRAFAKMLAGVPTHRPDTPCRSAAPASPQKRKWLSNAALLSGPFLICMLLWVLQNVINQQLDSRWGGGALWRGHSWAFCTSAFSIQLGMQHAAFSPTAGTTS